MPPAVDEGFWLLQAVTDFQARNQGSTENSQNVGRPVLLGTLFGLLMLLTLAAGVLAAIGRTPRMAAFVVLLLWVVTGVVLVVGAGAPIHCRMGAYSRCTSRGRARCAVATAVKQSRDQVN